MRDMAFIAEQQLQGMFAGRQFYLDLGLSTAKMYMLRIRRHRCVGRLKIGVDDQVVMPGVGFFRSGRRYAHATQAKDHTHGTGNGIARLRPRAADSVFSFDR